MAAEMRYVTSVLGLKTMQRTSDLGGKLNEEMNTLLMLLLEFLPATPLSDEVITVSVTGSLVYLSAGLTLN